MDERESFVKLVVVKQHVGYKIIEPGLDWKVFCFHSRKTVKGELKLCFAHKTSNDIVVSFRREGVPISGQMVED